MQALSDKYAERDVVALVIDVLEQEKTDRIARLEAEGESEADPSESPAEREYQRFELANQLLGLASDAMRETADALGDGAGEGAPDWSRVGEAAMRATEHLDSIRVLFYTISEHVRKLALDQVDVRDQTQDVIALSVTESRGAETESRARALAGDQQKLESRGGEIADALFVQAEEMGQGATQDALPDVEGERDRVRKAAEHVALAQLAMGEASASRLSEFVFR